MDSLTVAALLESLLKESRSMRADEAKYRAEGKERLADYISHKHGGFSLAMAFVLESIKSCQGESPQVVLADCTTEAIA